MSVLNKALEHDEDLWRILRAIAGADQSLAKHLITSTPELVRRGMRVGASRHSSRSYFLSEVERHVYAGDTALHLAAAAYDVDLARTLVSLGADVRARNRRGDEPLHYAAVGSPTSSRWHPERQADVIAYLIRVGANPNATDRDDVTPLHRAVRTRCAEAVRVLLVHGADVRATNGNGSTPLHLAVNTTGRGGTGLQSARAQQREIIHLLLTHGAHRSDTDERGQALIDRLIGSHSE